MKEMEFIKSANLYRPKMMQIAISILHNKVDGEDAIQETLFRCWLHLDSLRDEQKMRSWLFRCLTNNCLDMRRKSDRERLIIETLGKESKSCAKYDLLSFWRYAIC